MREAQAHCIPLLIEVSPRAAWIRWVRMTPRDWYSSALQPLLWPCSSSGPHPGFPFHKLQKKRKEKP